MATALRVQSTLTDRYQTTVPETVRRALQLGKRDKIRYTIRSGGEVVISRAAEAERDDPALGKFLDLLARDIATRPERLRPMDAALLKRVRALVGGMKVDLDAALSPDDE
jgi:antitoxin PrlF